MSIKASTKSDGDFPKEIVPAGNHVARLYSIIQIGKISEEYMGEMKMNEKVMLRFELPDEMREYGEKGMLPMAISREYTLSLGEKSNLRKLVEGLTGTPLDQSQEFMGIESLLGKWCMLNVIQKVSKTGKVYAQITSAAPLPKSMKAPAAINPDFVFDFEENYSDAKLAAMPSFIQDKIKSSEQYKKMGKHSKDFDIEDAPKEIDPAEIPF